MSQVIYQTSELVGLLITSTKNANDKYTTGLSFTICERLRAGIAYWIIVM